jgi:tetratricopeptide (TPR) repeat protein
MTPFEKFGRQKVGFYIGLTLAVATLHSWLGLAKSPSDLAFGNVQFEQSVLQKGIIDAENCKWSMAISNFTKAISLCPADSGAYNCRGVVYYVNGDLKSAIIDYSQCIQLDPFNYNSHLNRGNAYKAMQECQKAVNDFNECTQYCPTNYLAYKDRASVFSLKTNYEMAIKDITTSLSLNPKDSDAFVFRADMNLKRRHYKEAILDYKSAILIDPNNLNGYNDYAWFLATCSDASFRNSKNAIENAAKACQVAGWSRWETVDTLGVSYASSGNFEAAIMYEERAVNAKSIDGTSRGNIQKRILLFKQNRSFIDNGVSN